MIKDELVQKVEWRTFEITHPRYLTFVDCWVTCYDGNIHHFRYFPSPPKGAPYQIYRLGWPYDYLLGFGHNGELPYAFFSEFMYQCNNWYNYTLINLRHGRETEIRANERS